MRIVIWLAFIGAIGLVVWGAFSASKNQGDSTETGVVLGVDAVTPGDHTMGNASSTVEVVEFSDFQCPACRAYFPLVEQLIADYGSNFKFVYKHYPLPQHAHAEEAAYAAEAAGLQGKFFEMYRKLFENQLDWAEKSDARELFIGYAKEIGLNIGKFTSDIDGETVEDKVEDDHSAGVRSGVRGTPSFYLNGKQIKNPQSLEEFKSLIDKAAVQP
jgi:protein-disulfide isomerase